MTDCSYCTGSRSLSDNPALGPCVCAPWSRVEHIAPATPGGPWATLYCGDSLEVLPALTETVHSAVVDPPYGLGAHPDPLAMLRAWLAGEAYHPGGSGFMGKEWDGFVPGPEIWREVMRLLPPGGHLLSAFGTRTVDLGGLAVRIAGFEIRDMVAWVYGQGFPKSLNASKALEGLTCVCSPLPYDHARTETLSERDVRPMRDADVPPPVDIGGQRGEILQPSVSQQGAPRTMLETHAGQGAAGAAQWGLERRRDDAPGEGQLSVAALCALPIGVHGDGADGRLCDGTPAGHGSLGRSVSDASRDGAPHRPRSDEQPAQQPGTMAGQREPQESGTRPVCRGCGKPVVPEGLGTALKPALEPFVLARKPPEGTVAQTVLAHRTGALNIEACRVAGEATMRVNRAEMGYHGGNLADQYGTGSALGRWPANLCHDGSDEVLAAFPDAKGQQGASSDAQRSRAAVYGAPSDNGKTYAPRGDTGSAARFFYCAKASKADRNEGLDCLKSISLGFSTWDLADQKVTLLADMGQSPPRVIGGCSSADAIEWSNALFGNAHTAPFPPGTTCTTKIETNSTIAWKISNCLQRFDTNGSTAGASSLTPDGSSRAENADDTFPRNTITSEKTASLLGVALAALKTPLKISVEDGRSGHPTVKPHDLMRYLCRLVTPPGGTVLDPFMGSGSTGKAAVREGFGFIGIERDPEYFEIAVRRVRAAMGRPPGQP